MSDSDDNEEFVSVFDQFKQTPIESVKESKMDWGVERFSRKFFRRHRKHGESTYSIFGSWFSEHGFYIDKMSNLFGFGINDKGQLGLEGPEYRYFTQLVGTEEFGTVLKVCCGGKHTVFLIRDFVHGKNKVYSCGNNENGQLCRKTKSSATEVIKIVPTITNGTKIHPIVFREEEEDFLEIDNIFAGENHTVLLTKTLEIYVSGSNKLGQIGLGKEVEGQVVPLKLEFPKDVEIIHVYCGDNQTFFLTSKGHVFSVGDNRYSQAGVHKYRYVFVPTETYFSKMYEYYQIASCGRNIVILTSDGNLVTSLGREIDKGVVKVVAGHDKVVYFKEDGGVRSYDLSTNDSSNLIEEIPTQLTPHQVLVLKHIVYIFFKDDLYWIGDRSPTTYERIPLKVDRVGEIEVQRHPVFYRPYLERLDFLKGIGKDISINFGNRNVQVFKSMLSYIENDIWQLVSLDTDFLTSHGLNFDDSILPFFFVVNEEPHVFDFNTVDKYIDSFEKFMSFCLLFDKDLYMKSIGKFHSEVRNNILYDVIFGASSGTSRRELKTKIRDKMNEYIKEHYKDFCKPIKQVCYLHYNSKKKHLYDKKIRLNIRIITSDGKMEFAHKDILIFESDYFYKVFKLARGFREILPTQVGQFETVKINMTFNELKVFLRFIYLGEVRLESFFVGLSILSKIQEYDDFEFEDALIMEMLNISEDLVKDNYKGFKKVVTSFFEKHKIERSIYDLFLSKWEPERKDFSDLRWKSRGYLMYWDKFKDLSSEALKEMMRKMKEAEKRERRRALFRRLAEEE
jgi:hypothetical protein